MLLLIGSQAIRHHVENYRMPADTDLVGTYDDVMEYRKAHSMVACYPINAGASVYMRDSSGHITEAEIAWSGSRAEKLIEFVAAQEDTLYKGAFMIPSLDVLYLLKMSHKYLKDSKHFLKTMRDTQHLEILGAKIRPEHQDFYDRRTKATYNYAHPSLKQSKKDFFNDSVQYTYSHDDIHEAVKTLPKPAYSYFKLDEAEVQCSKDKFESCNHFVKLLSVYEEACVLSLERAIIPHGKMSIKESFDMALMKLSTSISSGWWREWAWNHYDEVQGLYDEGYVAKFWKAVGDGRVRLHTN